MSPRSEDANQRIRNEQRQRILDAATTIFARKGLTDTKMTEIASAAGISYGLAYHYFTNKEAIFTALMEEAFEGALGLIQRVKELPATPQERMYQLLSETFAGLQSEPETFLLVLQALTNEAVPQEMREMAQRQSQEFRLMLKLLIIQGQAAGQFVSGDPGRLATLFSACIQGLATEVALRRRLPEDFPSAADVLRLLQR